MHSRSDSFIFPALIISYMYPDLKLNVVEMEIFKYSQNASFSSIGLKENHF